jgi:hypothetical protein
VDQGIQRAQVIKWLINRGDMQVILDVFPSSEFGDFFYYYFYK